MVEDQNFVSLKFMDFHVLKKNQFLLASEQVQPYHPVSLRLPSPSVGVWRERAKFSVILLLRKSDRRGDGCTL